MWAVSFLYIASILWSNETKKKKLKQFTVKTREEIVKNKFEAHCVARKANSQLFLERQNSFLCRSECHKDTRVENQMTVQLSIFGIRCFKLDPQGKLENRTELMNIPFDHIHPLIQNYE